MGGKKSCTDFDLPCCFGATAPTCTSMWLEDDFDLLIIDLCCLGTNTCGWSNGSDVDLDLGWDSHSHVL